VEYENQSKFKIRTPLFNFYAYFSNNEKIMSFKDHIGVDANRKTLYRKIRRLGQVNDFKYLDGRIDVVPNALETFDKNRCGPVRESPAEPVFI